MSNDQRTLTTRQGHPVSDNQSLRSVGERGPATLENYQFIEKITHFDRERIPERVVHARGTGAHGYFEAYGTIGGEPASRAPRAPARALPGAWSPPAAPALTATSRPTAPSGASRPPGTPAPRCSRRKASR